jgi:hypothetical protein
MAKMNAIQAQLEAAAGRKPATATTPPELAATSVKAAPRTTSRKPASREGRVHVGAWLPEAYSRNILLMRAKTGLPVKTIFATALNDLFRAHGVPVIDEE